MSTMSLQNCIVVPETRSWFFENSVAVMVCRSWAVTDSFGQQLAKGYILCDDAGFAIQGEARCGNPDCCLCTMKEGSVYRLTNFSLVPNATSYRFSKLATLCLQLQGNTTVAALECSMEGFVRHPIHITEIENITSNQSKYLIDVIGLVVEVGVSRPTNRGNFIVDCHIISSSGLAIRLALWNSAATTLINLEAMEKPMNICIFTGLDVRDFMGELYLSSTPATVVHSSEAFPAAHAHFMRNIGSNPQPPPSEITKAIPEEDHSLTQILYIGRANSAKGNQASVTMHCKVRILGLRGDHPWFEHTCPIAGCQKGVAEVGGAYWCNDCEMLCQYAPPSYRLHIDVTDGLSIVTVAFLGQVGDQLMGKPATNAVAELGEHIARYSAPPMMLPLANSIHIIELKSHTYLEYSNHEAFTCSALFKDNNNIKLGIVTHDAVLDEYIAGRYLPATDFGGTKTKDISEKMKAGAVIYASDEE